MHSLHPHGNKHAEQLGVYACRSLHTVCHSMPQPLLSMHEACHLQVVGLVPALLLFPKNRDTTWCQMDVSHCTAWYGTAAHGAAWHHSVQWHHHITPRSTNLPPYDVLSLPYTIQLLCVLCLISACVAARHSSMPCGMPSQLVGVTGWPPSFRTESVLWDQAVQSTKVVGGLRSIGDARVAGCSSQHRTSIPSPSSQHCPGTPRQHCTCWQLEWNTNTSRFAPPSDRAI